MKLFAVAISCLLYCLILSAPTVFAAPANPAGSVYYQPDGSPTPILFLNGDEYYSWMSDAKGYTVIKDAHGWYVYGKKEGGDIVSAGVRVGHTNPKKLGLTPQLTHDDEFRRGLIHEKDKEHRDLIKVPTAALCNFNANKNSPCRLKGLVVLIRFSNHANRVLPSPEEYDILFNNNGPTSNSTAPTGSVADVWRQNSYDTFVLENVISQWVPVSKSEAFAVAGNYGLELDNTKVTWNEAVTLARSQFGDYTQFDGDHDGNFDCLVLLHSGSAAETGGIDIETNGDSTTRIWSHATSGQWYNDGAVASNRFYVASGIWDTKPTSGIAYTVWGISRLAVIAHECGHFLGLPDLYDVTIGSGLGTFELMGT